MQYSRGSADDRSRSRSVGGSRLEGQTLTLQRSEWRQVTSRREAHIMLHQQEQKYINK